MSHTNSIDQFRHRTQEEDEDMANCLILLAQGKVSQSQPPPDQKNNNNSELYLYQCKTCNKCFPSFQALGGHRASHKKPNKANTIGTEKRLVTTFINEEEHDHYGLKKTNTTLFMQIPKRPFSLYRSITTSTTIAATTKSKVHECSICGSEFSSGQALGGHMRRHRTSINTSITTVSVSDANIIDGCGGGGGGGGGSPEYHEIKKPRTVLKLDLNLPAPDDDGIESMFTFQSRESVIVFSAPSLVNCHY
ncbi:putative transcription factor C2H2 family [Lupinus albus]|uniref:Putative transcription factor C2H2 family n=1 Tax=Lupinus albus TaxID=3870 RepID=A0A6A4R2Q0_LUPAL|nr:putative transcription factor C2H2 family [Lupinus albus]